MDERKLLKMALTACHKLKNVIIIQNTTVEFSVSDQTPRGGGGGGGLLDLVMGGYVPHRL